MVIDFSLETRHREPKPFHLSRSCGLPRDPTDSSLGRAAAAGPKPNGNWRGFGSVVNGNIIKSTNLFFRLLISLNLNESFNFLISDCSSVPQLTKNVENRNANL
jgi:hypothetical protein